MSHAAGAPRPARVAPAPRISLRAAAHAAPPATTSGSLVIQQVAWAGVALPLSTLVVATVLYFSEFCRRRHAARAAAGAGGTVAEAEAGRAEPKGPPAPPPVVVLQPDDGVELGVMITPAPPPDDSAAGADEPPDDAPGTSASAALPTSPSLLPFYSSYSSAGARS